MYVCFLDLKSIPFNIPATMEVGQYFYYLRTKKYEGYELQSILEKMYAKEIERSDRWFM